jgi:hypothetical protein
MTVHALHDMKAMPMYDRFLGESIIEKNADLLTSPRAYDGNETRSMIRAFQKGQGVGTASPKHLAGESPNGRRRARKQADLVDDRGKLHLDVRIEV